MPVTDCLWCGVPVPQPARGRRRRYCCAAHRTAAWRAVSELPALRAALQRMQADADRATRRREPWAPHRRARVREQQQLIAAIERLAVERLA